MSQKSNIAAYNIVNEKSAMSEKPGKTSLSFDLYPWLFWIAGVVVTLLPILLIFIERYIWQTDQSKTGWYVDVMGHAGLLIVSISMAVAVVYELVIKGKKTKGTIGIGIILFILSICASYLYSSIMARYGNV